MAVRAAHFALNNAHGARMVQSLANNAVGGGIKLKARSDSPIINLALLRTFDTLTDEIDWAGQGDFHAMQRAVMAHMVIHGEALLMWRDSPHGIPQLQRLHPEQLDPSITRVVSDDAPASLTAWSAQGSLPKTRRGWMHRPVHHRALEH